MVNWDYGSVGQALQVARKQQDVNADVTWPGGRMANRSMRQAYRTLYETLQRQGQTDPRLFNQQLSNISRSSEANQQAYGQGLAAQGMGGSGLGQMGGAALAQGGLQARSHAFATESALTEARKRQDLEMIISLILNPRLAYRAQNLGLNMQQDQAAAARSAANAQAIASIVGTVSSAYGRSGGGGGGYSSGNVA